MSPGTHVRIKPEWQHAYRKPGSKLEGVIRATSPSGAVSRVTMDDLGDSYVLVHHLEPVLSAGGAVWYEQALIAAGPQ